MQRVFSYTVAGLMIAVSLAISSASYAEPPAGKGKKEDVGSPAAGKSADKGKKDADEAKAGKHADRGKGKNQDNEKRAGKDKKDKAEHSVIASDDLKAIRDFLKSDHAKNCPPGLAKKDNGCLPPGISKKYTVGKPLPEGLAMTKLPEELLKKLKPVAGHKYGKIDNDVVLISEATKKVVDAVSLLSSVK